MSNHRISGSHALVVDQLSTVSIPSNVQDALADPKWTKAMNEELEALQKNATWELVPMPVGKKTMELLIDTRRGWLPKDIHNAMGLIMRRLLHLWQRSILSGF
ncbi:hypothetical protein RchiOBHm_Chr2g0157511 [Rosa chinensis]|uniref:Uncharacterized protein n=1 Tax=Rosa chinensis TaxID=74649 RepID=A0A2P6S1Q5_ROSCH|nr:hypothetical protein RchiOBHm_Chr2g0157511 [Rosa chinensis]